MNVDLLTLAGVLAGLAVIPWIHIGKNAGTDDGWAPRLTSWLLAFSAAAFTLAVPAWRDTLAAATDGSRGLGVLTVAVIVSGMCFWFQAVHRRKDPKKPKAGKNGVQQQAKVLPRHKRHHYNRVRTMAISAAFGTAFVLAWVRGKQIIGELAKSPARYQTALGQFGQQVRNGSAGKAMTTAQWHHNLEWGLVVFVALCLALRGFERKRHGKPVLLPAKKKAAKGGGGGGGRGAPQSVPGAGGPRQIEG